MLLPAGAAAQESATLVSRVDSLVTFIHADTTTRGLGDLFMAELQLLLPDLSTEQLDILRAAVTQSFAPTAVHADVSRALVAGAAPPLISELLERYRSGALGELQRLADAYQPSQTFAEFMNGLGTPPRERLQLMVELGEAYGASTRQILVGEALQESAHAVVTLLGARLGPLQRLSDAQFDAAYRQYALSHGLNNLYRLAPASDELVRRASAELASEAGRWLAGSWAAASTAAVHAAAGRVAELTVVETNDSTPPAASAPASAADSGLPCIADPCAFFVDWEGPEPTDHNSRFGNSGALSVRVMENLTRAGYLLVLRDNLDEFSIRLKPRLTDMRCEFMPGTDDSTCVAIAEVRVAFIGTFRDRPKPEDFTVRNQCGSDGAMDVDGIATLVAARILYAFKTTPGEEPPQPRC